METDTPAAVSETWAPAGAGVGVSEQIEGSAQQDLSAGDTTLDSGWYTLPCGIEVYYSHNVINDVTGKWRLSRTTSAEPIEDHVLEYYQQMFSSDEEVHGVWNVSLGTMTRINVAYGMIFVDTLEYVNGEENDAKMMFTGNILAEKAVDISTGEVSDLRSEDGGEGAESILPIAGEISASTESVASVGYTSPPIVTDAPTTPAPTQKPAPAETSYVLNTSTMKFHKPSCHDVSRINAGNRQDYTGTRDSVIAMGYSPCGHCSP